MSRYSENGKAPAFVRETLIMYIIVFVLFIVASGLYITGIAKDKEKDTKEAYNSEYEELDKVNAISMNYISGEYSNKIYFHYSLGFNQMGITTYDDYLNKTLYIKMNKDNIEAADLIEMKADDNYISEVLLRENEDYIELEVRLDGLYNSELSFSENQMVVTLNPFDKDRFIVVFGVSQNEKIGAIVDEVSRRLDSDYIDIYRFVATGNEAKMLDFIKESGADMYIGMEMPQSTDSNNVATEVYYNPDYFIPGANSLTLSDALLENIIAVTKDDNGGINSCADTDVILKKAAIPATRIILGYRVDANRRVSIDEENYEVNVADAVIKAILHERDMMSN